ncbi:glycosylated lysosomal membrane protein B-like [Culicoides brevitarsis]|uniref:glycosylated lysosomal membrane protein B-like n=1 Tax=Culicoides brevitarsis TaxID=469753 RepID=UPI00307C02D3
MHLLPKFLIFSIFITFCSSTDLADDKIKRKLTAVLNPDCPAEFCGSDRKINVMHVTADSDRDRIHYLWSFAGKPSFLMAFGDLNSSMSIDWASFLGFSNGTEKSVTITPEPKYATITVLNQIFEFNDPADHGDFLNVTDKNILPLDTSLFGYEFNGSTVTPEFVEFKVKATKYHNTPNITNIGAVIYTVQCYGDKGHGGNYPHLLHNSNNTQVDVVFDRFKQKKSFKSPRLAIEMAFATTDTKDSNATFHITKRRTLDDEHTPGIFELDTLVSPHSYIEYRPVSYTKPVRDVSDSTDTHLSKIVDATDEFMYKSLVYAYFGFNENHMLKSVNVSFGAVNDGFYSKTNYTSFAFLIGLGQPPTEELSPLVMAITFVGLGIPAVLFVLGATCILVKRVRTYRRLNSGLE